MDSPSRRCRNDENLAMTLSQLVCYPSPLITDGATRELSHLNAMEMELPEKNRGTL